MTTLTDTPPQAHPADLRRPGVLELLAGGLLLATVILHVVAMAPTYFTGSGSLMSQPDQAALYAVLAAAWALALVIGLTGPHRTPVAAALAAGIALTELGLRISDLADALRYGTGGPGVWLMVAAWGVGAAGAVIAVMAARSRHAAPVAPAEPEPSEWKIDWTSPGAAPEPPRASGYSVPEHYDPHERTAWTLLAVVLAVLVAGTFLPPWDHGVAVYTATGRTVSQNLGNAFKAPWQEMLGSVLTAVALLVIPIVAIRMRNRAAGAAAAVGTLLVLSSQFVSAIVQVDDPASAFGITSAQARNLGVQLSMKLTGWFVVDAIAAYALFAAVMVWATLKHPHENSAGTAPTTP